MPRSPASRRAGAADAAVLAVDTTAAACSVAVDRADRTWRRAMPMTHGHSRVVLDLVDAVLADAGIVDDDIDLVAFGGGPGSFTGLRIACGIAQGLAFGWDRPVVAVDSMRTLASQAFADAPAEIEVVLVALDLRMGELCAAAYRRFARDAWPEPLLAPTLASPTAARERFAMLALPGRTVRAGDGWDVHALLEGGAGGSAEASQRPAHAIQPDAVAVARLARVAWRIGRAVDAAQATPLYLRDKVALDVDEQAVLRASRTPSRTAGARR